MIIRRAAERHRKTLFHLPELKLDCRHFSHSRSFVGVKRKNIFRSGEIVDVYKTCWYSIFFLLFSVCAHKRLCSLCSVLFALEAFFSFACLLNSRLFYLSYILSAQRRQKLYYIEKIFREHFWNWLDNLIGAPHSAFNCFGISTWLYIEHNTSLLRFFPTMCGSVKVWIYSL